MRSKSMLAFALAIACGLVAMVGVQQVLQKKTVDLDADKVQVFVAATEILPGQVIDMNMLARQKFLKTSVPKEAVLDPKLLEKRAFIVKMMPGDIVRSDKLGAEGKTGASISIPNGMRVISIATNTTQAHSGMIQPGDRVDVMVTYRVQPPQGGGRDYPETKTILGNIQVFATDNVRDTNTGTESTKGTTMKNVSLLVTPEQAQVVQMAVDVGVLALSLRNASDTKEVEITKLSPDLFRNSVVLNGASGNNPALQPEPRANSTTELNDFLDDAAGNGPDSKTSAPGSDTEPWDIAFYGKDGVKVETLQVSRREVPPPATATRAADQSESKSVMNSLLNMFQLPRATSNEKQSAVQRETKERVQAADGKPVEAKPTSSTKGKSPAPQKSKSNAKLPRTVTSTSIAK